MEAAREALCKARCGSSSCLKLLMALALGHGAGLRLQASGVMRSMAADAAVSCCLLPAACCLLPAACCLLPLRTAGCCTSASALPLRCALLECLYARVQIISHIAACCPALPPPPLPQLARKGVYTSCGHQQAPTTTTTPLRLPLTACRRAPTSCRRWTASWTGRAC